MHVQIEEAGRLRKRGGPEDLPFAVEVLLLPADVPKNVNRFVVAGLEPARYNFVVETLAQGLQLSVSYWL